MNAHTFCITIPIGFYHPFLRDCLNSLAIQTPKPQVALMDASDDPRVAAIADEFNDVIAHRHHGPDAGQTDAIMTGWAHLEGDVLGWLNADDLLFPNALADASKALSENPDAALVYGHSQIVNDANKVTGFHWNVAPPNDQINTHCYISQPSCFFRQSAYNAIGSLNRDLHYTMDWDLWIKLYENGGDFAFIDKVMSKVLWTSEAKTGGFGSARRRELRRLIDKSPSRKARLNAYLGFASHHMLEYVVPKGMKLKAWRRNTDGGQGLFGLYVGGAIPEEAHIPLVHYDADAKTSIEIDFDGDLSAMNWQVDGQAIEPDQVEAGSAELQLPQPVSLGQEITLTARRNGKQDFYLNGIRL